MKNDRCNAAQPKMAGSPDIVNNEAVSANAAESAIKPTELPDTGNGKDMIGNDANCVNETDDNDEHNTSEGFV